MIRDGYTYLLVCFNFQRVVVLCLVILFVIGIQLFTFIIKLHYIYKKMLYLCSCFGLSLSNVKSQEVVLEARDIRVLKILSSNLSRFCVFSRSLLRFPFLPSSPVVSIGAFCPISMLDFPIQLFSW